MATTTRRGTAVSIPVVTGQAASNSYARAITPDDSIIVGKSGNRAYRFTVATGVLEDVRMNPGVHYAGNSYQALGVTDDGLMLFGQITVDEFAGPRAVRWTQAGGTQVIPLPTGWGNASMGGGSADGAVVVGWGGASTTFGPGTGWWWTAAGGTVAIGAHSASYGTTLKAVSADGSIAVGYADTGDYNTTALTYTPGGGKVLLPSLPYVGAMDKIQAVAVSANGTAIAGYASPTGGNFRGVIWNNRVLTDIGFPDGYDAFYVDGISRDGLTVAGTAYQETSPGSGSYNTFACSWTAAGGFSILRSPDYAPDSGAQLSSAYAVSASGVVLGRGTGAMYWTPLPPPVPHGDVEIVFEPLTDTPMTSGATSGAALSTMPALQAVAYQVAGNFALLTLPALIAASVGSAGAMEAPSSGNALLELPALIVAAQGGGSVHGTATLTLPVLRAQSYEVPGSHVAMELPPLAARSFQALPVPTGYALLAPQPVMSVLGSDTWVLRDGVVMDSAEIATTIHVLIERLRMTGSAWPSSTRLALADDGLVFSDALAIAWQVMIAEGVDLIGTAMGSPNRLAVVVDTLHATGVTATRKDALAVVMTVLAVNGMLATGWKMDAIDTVDFRDALVGSLAAIGKLVDGAGFGDSLTPSMRISAVMAETLALDDDPAARLDMYAALIEDVLLYATIRLGASEYAGWVLNEGAPSEYRNYPFNGFASFNGRYYGTSDDGLYLLEGGTDAGTPIESRVRTALMDFGTGVLKRIPDVYVAFAGGNKLVLKVITTDSASGGAQVENHYTANVPPGTSLHNGRIKPGQGLRSRYWQFELVNVDGADFELAELSFRPMMLDRRL